MNKKDSLIFILLISLISTVVFSEPQFKIEDSAKAIKAWINSTGSLNITQDFICPDCINPEDVNDIDDAEVETDLNTYVDIAGDTMTGELIVPTLTLGWVNLTGYPNACTAGQYVSQIADTLTCVVDQTGNTSAQMVTAINTTSYYQITSRNSSQVYNSTYNTLINNASYLSTYNVTYQAQLNHNTTKEIVNVFNTTGYKLNDNIKAYFGTDNDWCMYYDGTSLITSNSC